MTDEQFDDAVDAEVQALIDLIGAHLLERREKADARAVMAATTVTAVDMVAIALSAFEYRAEGRFPREKFLDDVRRDIERRTAEMTADAMTSMAIKQAKEAA